MSCGCNNTSTACPDVPYPTISPESVPSLIDNLVYALYGTINKSVNNGRVVWDIPCDPTSSPAEVSGIPREEGEGLLCYIIRVLNEDVAVIPNVMTTNANQTVTGIKTFTQNIIGSVVGDVFASNGTTKILENGTGANATFTGNVIGNVTGNVTGNIVGNVTGNVTGAASLNVLKTGDTMTGALIVPAGATGSQAPRASEVVAKTGDTMTGGLVVSTSSTSTSVRITQTGTGNALLVEDSTNPDNSPFVVTASGNIGVGKLVPTQKLDVDGDAIISGELTCSSIKVASSVNSPTFIARINGGIADITSITSISFVVEGSGSIVTIGRASHGLIVDDSITFIGQTGSNTSLNGTWKILSADTNSFSFQIESIPSGSLQISGITSLLPIRIARATFVWDIGYGNSTPNKIGHDANGSYTIYFYNSKDNSTYLALGNCCNNAIAAGAFSPYTYSTELFTFKTYTIGTATQANFTDINIVIY